MNDTWIAFPVGSPDGLWFVAGPDYSLVTRALAFTEREARLIAAAPKLLAALQVHHEWSKRNQRGYSADGDERVAYRATSAAIANATGAT